MTMEKINKKIPEADFMRVYQELNGYASSNKSQNARTAELKRQDLPVDPSEVLERLEAKREFLTLIEKGTGEPQDRLQEVDRAIQDLKDIIHLLDHEDKI